MPPNLPNQLKERKMSNKKEEQQDKILEEVTGGEYKYGFQSEVEMDMFPKGLNEDIIRKISEIKMNPDGYWNFA